MRRHRSFRAAWVFGYAGGQREPGQERAYHLVLLMHPRDDVAFRDLDLVVHTVSKKTYEVQVGLLYETDAAAIAMTFRQAQPFYIAPDYHPPQPGAPGA